MNLAAAESDLAGDLHRLETRFAQRLVALPDVSPAGSHVGSQVEAHDGPQIAVRCAGPAGRDGDTIVLLHGIGSGAASWLHVAMHLAAQARVLAWDAPGYGDSTPLASPAPSAADYAARLAGLLRALRIERCVLVGHSLGALMAAAYASGEGVAVVRRLVLISPARGYGHPARAAQREAVLQSRLRKLREHGVAGIADDAPARMLGPDAGAAARDWVRWNAARLNPHGYAQAVQMLCADAIESHRPLAMPVTVLVGDADIVTRPDDCREAARELCASFATLPCAGHASPVECPCDVARHLALAAGLSAECP